MATHLKNTAQSYIITHMYMHGTYISFHKMTHVGQMV